MFGWWGHRAMVSTPLLCICVGYVVWLQRKIITRLKVCCREESAVTLMALGPWRVRHHLGTSAKRPRLQMNLGQKLAQLRESKRLTQPQLGALSGVHPTTISNIERGDTKEPSTRTLRRLAVALGALLSDLVADDSYDGKSLKPGPVLNGNAAAARKLVINRERKLLAAFAAQADDATILQLEIDLGRAAEAAAAEVTPGPRPTSPARKRR